MSMRLGILLFALATLSGCTDEPVDRDARGADDAGADTTSAGFVRPEGACVEGTPDVEGCEGATFYRCECSLWGNETSWFCRKAAFSDFIVGGPNGDAEGLCESDQDCVTTTVTASEYYTACGPVEGVEGNVCHCPTP